MELIISMIFIILLQWNPASAYDALLKSFERAMKCTHREPPAEPVIAMSPFKYSQLVALIRHNLDTPACNKNQIFYQFDMWMEVTWRFCLFGVCYKNTCHCLPSYTGKHCGTYKNTCWMFYCFLDGCNPATQYLICKCDPRLYGNSVLTGEFWYDDGPKSEFEFPPPGWVDDRYAGHTLKDVEKLVQEHGSHHGGKKNQKQHGGANAEETAMSSGPNGPGRQNPPPVPMQENPQYGAASPEEEALRSGPNGPGPQNPPPGPMEPQENLPDGDMLRIGQPQNAPNLVPKNQGLTNSQKTQLMFQNDESNEDLKEAFEEEDSSAFLLRNDRNTFYVVIFLNVLLNLWIFQ